MSTKMSRISLPLRVGLAAVAWGVLLFVAWAIHPVEGVGRAVPVENPSPTQQASVDLVLAGSNPAQGDQIVRFQCDNSPLEAVGGDRGASSAPVLDVGFEYAAPPCSQEYDAARTALWFNVLAIAMVFAASIAIHIRLRNRSTAGRLATDALPVVARSDS